MWSYPGHLTTNRCQSSGLLFHYAKIVGHRQDRRDLIDANRTQILIALTVDDAFEGHPRVLYDDTDGRIRIAAVLEERAIAVDRLLYPLPDLLVHGAGRKDFD